MEVESRELSDMGKANVMIIDYGMGNVGSVAAAIEYLGGSYFASNSKEDFAEASAFILPGVGAFGAAMENLKNLDLIESLNEQVLVKTKPFLGICLGMQILAKDSTELGFHNGLGWVDGHVLALQPEEGLRVPHVGWNNVSLHRDPHFFHRIDSDAIFYFDHSYYLQCSDDIAVATFEYGETYTAAIRRDNIFATQFHPEKSQRNGLKMLRNFLNFIANPGT